MKTFRNILSVVTVGFLVSGCMYPGGRPDYTASGALAGAATGATIGAMSAHSGPGALVGGAIGAIAGGLVGHGMDAEQEAQLRSQAPQTYERVQQEQPLTVPDVKALARAGIGDDLIISQIRNSRTVYHLTTSEIIELKNSGVSEQVIDFMINTQTQTASVAGVSGQMPPAPLPEPVYVAPGPDFIWIAGAWAWSGDCWVWRRGYWHRPYGPYAHGPRRHWY